MAIDISTLRIEKFLATIKKRSPTYSTAVLYLAILKNEMNQLKIGYGLMNFIGRTDSILEDKKYDYGNFILVKKSLSITDAIELLRLVFTKQTIPVEGLAEIPIKITFCPADLVPSGGHFASNEWPSLFTARDIEGETRAGQLPYNALSKIGLPLFPSGNEAVISFMGLKRFRDWSNLSNNFEIIVPDFRARIKRLRLSSNRMTLEVETRESPENELRVKFYCRNQENSFMSDDLRLEKGQVSFVAEKEPFMVNVHLLSTIDGETIDSRNIDYRYTSDDKSIIIENNEDQLNDMINKGESETVEFKVTLDSHNTREFLETVVAFANTKGGTIFLGVNDNCEVKEFREDVKARIADLIHGNCDPPIDVKVRTVILEGNHQITIVEVAEGTNKPYFLNNRGIFIRRGSSDRQIRRMELDDLYAKKTGIHIGSGNY